MMEGWEEGITNIFYKNCSHPMNVCLKAERSSIRKSKIMPIHFKKTSIYIYIYIYVYIYNIYINGLFCF